MANNSATKLAKTIVEQKLIEIVRQRPAIFDLSHRGHKNSIVIENNWQAVFDGLGEQNIVDSPAACTDLWKTLRAQYMAFKRKVKGKSWKKGGRPSFRHELSMQFFDDKDDDNEETMSNVNYDDDNSLHETTLILRIEVSNEDTVEHVNLVSSQQPSPALLSPANVDNSILDQSDASNSSNSSRSTTSSRMHQAGGSRNAKTVKTSFDDRLIECLKPQALDEYQSYANTIALKLKKIANQDRRAVLEIQKKINDVIFEVELNVLS